MYSKFEIVWKRFLSPHSLSSGKVFHQGISMPGKVWQSFPNIFLVGGKRFSIGVEVDPSFNKFPCNPNYFLVNGKRVPIKVCQSQVRILFSILIGERFPIRVCMYSDGETFW